MAIRALSPSTDSPSIDRESPSIQPQNGSVGPALDAVPASESNEILKAQSYRDKGSASFVLAVPPSLDFLRPGPWIQSQPELSLVSSPTPRSGIEGMIHSSSDPTLGEAPGPYADESDFVNTFVLIDMI